MARNKEPLTLSPYSYLPCGTGSTLAFVSSKEAIFNHLVMDKLGRTLGMFEYENLPKTIDPVILEIYLQTQGYAIIVPVNGDLYVLNGTLGGELNASYRPTLAMPVSPYLNFSEQCEIGKDCVVIKANELYKGFAEINSLYAGLLTEAYQTLRVELINARVPSILRVTDDTSKANADNFFKKVINGDISALVTDDTLEDIVEGAKALDFNNKGMSKIKDTMEVIQYLIARWNIELGLNDNYNMKREAINSTEVDSNTMPLETLVDVQMSCRKKGFEEVNKLFGTEIKVKLGKDWKRAYEYVIQAMKNAEVDNEQSDQNKIEEERKEAEEGKENGDQTN